MRRALPLALLLLVIPLAGVRRCAPRSESPPPVVPPDAGPAPRACKAGPHECCQRDGTIVKAHCSPTDNGPDRGPGGWCEGCTLRCLPAAALIATPDGERAVSTLRAGDLVYTTDASGARVVEPILLVRAHPAPPTHEVVRSTLADGRVVRASPGHPILDPVAVVETANEPLGGDATWDLLPAGPTGAYWADGVLLGSTLAPDDSR